MRINRVECSELPYEELLDAPAAPGTYPKPASEAYFAAKAAGEGQEEPEGGDEPDLVALDAPPGEDSDTDKEGDVEMSNVERLKKDAVSIPHLLTHHPKNPFCPTCNWAKTLRKQQRRFQNKGIKVERPYANPTAFGHLITMDHWFAADELSQGIHGETACVTLRDRATNFLSAIGVRDKCSDRNVAAGGSVDRAVQCRAHPPGEQSLPVAHHLVARDHCALIPRRSAIDVNCSSG